MLIKIQNIEDECADLDEEVEELRKRIAKTLIEEEGGKEKAAADHQVDVDTIMSGNQR
jgi:hypothetical protein